VAFAASYRWGGHLGRLIAHPDPEQLLFRVLGLTLIAAGLAELVYVSAAVGAFLVGLALSGDIADQARTVLGPLRDLFAATFFLAIGFSVGPAALLPVLPIAAGLAVVSIAGKLGAGWYAAGRNGVGWRGRLRAGTALIAHGEFSVVIIGLVGAQHEVLGPLVVAYVFILALAGPVLARFAGSG
jgi:monovalent cation:H+ antiporter-2, CPA2 family